MDAAYRTKMRGAHLNSYQSLRPYFVPPQSDTSFAPSRAVAGALWRSPTRALWRVGDHYPQLRGAAGARFFEVTCSPVKHSTLADANELRDWHIYSDFAQVLIAQARKLHASDPGVLDLKETTNALDSTTIDLCLSSFPWAVFRKTKAAVKMHTLLDRGITPNPPEPVDLVRSVTRRQRTGIKNVPPDRPGARSR